jgi:hypothetical protein
MTSCILDCIQFLVSFKIEIVWLRKVKEDELGYNNNNNNNKVLYKWFLNCNKVF